MLGVACILLSGITMSVLYVGSWDAFYGTAYGVMVLAKIGMFAMLLGLGFGNFRIVERLRWDPATPVTRMKRFAEVELAIGFSIFFAAASLTSVPPAIDLTEDRVSWHEIMERNRPVWPRLASPDYDTLALPALQAQLDAEAAQQASKPAPAFVPGSGLLPARNAADIAWSEYNHHWSGIFVLAIAVLALLNQAGLRLARHWPLLFLGLAVFLFFRSDPEVWPLGEISFVDSMRDVEVVQHRFFVLLIVALGLFEWRAGGRLAQPMGGVGVSPGDCRRRCGVADPQPRHRQCEGRAADRAEPHSAGADRHRRRLRPLAGTGAWTAVPAGSPPGFGRCASSSSASCSCRIGRPECRVRASCWSMTTRMCAMSAEVLRHAGFEVLTANGGPQAAELLRHGERFAALVTDQSMPDLDGLKLMEMAIRLQPGLPCLLMTGYMDEFDGDAAVLRKPFRAANTSRRCRSCFKPMPLAR